MSKVSILDCTLRDGGYINDWRFGETEIKGIIKELNSSGIDIIECGFLADEPYDKDVAVFSCISQIKSFIAPKREDAMYVAMIAFGDISPDKILKRDKDSIDGIRLTFHKHEWEDAKEAALQLMDKGYEVFVQPVGTTSYSDAELLKLLEDVNKINPFAFYLVDTLGLLSRRGLRRIASFVDYNLNPGIAMGFHSHNNLQLSLSNGLELMRQDFKRHLIIDTSVYGMGRGVGNLPTELLTYYINDNMYEKYNIIPLLVIADQYLMSIYANQRWGYDLPYFISAMEKCHPNYASYLMKKDTLNIESIATILKDIPKEKKDLFNKDIVEEVYLKYQDRKMDDSDTIEKLNECVKGRNILLLAPGASIGEYKDKIQEEIQKNNALVIGVNFVQDVFDEDIIFMSSRKRLHMLKEKLENEKFVIVTSNLTQELPQTVDVANYSSYLGEGSDADNAGAMLLRMLKKTEVGEILLAGFDGFEVDVSSNYYIDSFRREMEKDAVDNKNESVSSQLKEALTGLSYRVVTPTRYQI